jgi:hypothetical protein
MEKIASTSELKEAIQQLEYQQAMQLELLKDQFHSLVESLKPVNVIRSTISDLAKSPDLLREIVNTTIGLSAGSLTRKIFARAYKANPIKKFLVGNLLQFGITHLITKHPDAIRMVTGKLASIFKRKERSKLN